MDTKSVIFVIIIIAITVSLGGNIIYQTKIVTSEIDQGVSMATLQTKNKKPIFRKINLELDEEKSSTPQKSCSDYIVREECAKDSLCEWPGPSCVLPGKNCGAAYVPGKDKCLPKK